MGKAIRQRSRPGVAESLRHGHAAYARRAWADAYQYLSIADAAGSLEIEDLELLARSAYLIGREDEYVRALDRAHQACVRIGSYARAARSAFWIGLSLLLRGEGGPATGWFGRAERLVKRQKRGCVEEGYLLVSAVERSLAAGEAQSAYAAASSAADIGERFGDPELIACARHQQGRSLVATGQVDRGLALLDEAMVAVVSGELSPIMNGLIYCSVISACQQVYALTRAREWTSALAGWCAEQPQLVSFTGACLVHRAEIMQLHGAWPDALEEARRACSRLTGHVEQLAGSAFYQQGEVQRLRGEFGEAELSYREASRHGYDPHPGLALLRLAQGHIDAAAAAIRRCEPAVTDQLERTRLLPAFIEIMLAFGDIESARSASRELDVAAEIYGVDVLNAIAAQSRGAVLLAVGEAADALRSLRLALDIWQKVEAPYQTARARELMGLTCRSLGDAEGADLEFSAARDTYRGLGAKPDVARLESTTNAGPSRGCGLTHRELQVLRMLADGKTNKTIAATLFISRRTVDRHVSNIFVKLNVASRAAATGYALTHKLI